MSNELTEAPIIDNVPITVEVDIETMTDRLNENSVKNFGLVMLSYKDAKAITQHYMSIIEGTPCHLTESMVNAFERLTEVVMKEMITE